jgi:hypothetical protein
LLACVAIVVLIVWTLRGNARTGSLEEDADLIRAVIENGFRVSHNACLEENHERIDDYKAELAAYWSAVEPTGSVLAERQAAHENLWTTPDATFVTSYAATLVARGSALPGTAEAELAFRPTPVWRPEYSPLESVQARVDVCQDSYGVPGQQATSFALNNVSINNIDVDGDTATAVATMTYTSIFSDAGSGPTTYNQSEVYDYLMHYEIGEWRIREEKWRIDW